MNKKELDTYLNKAIPRAVMLYGEEEFYISYYSRLISKKIAPRKNHSYFYFSDYDQNEVINYLSTESLFGDKAVVVAKLDLALTKSQFAAVRSALERNANSYFVVEFYRQFGSSDAEHLSRMKAFSSLFKPSNVIKDIVEVRFFPPSKNEAIGILSKKAKRLKLNISDETLEHLYEIQNIQNNSLSWSLNELEKFTNYDNVNNRLVESLSLGIGNFDMNGLIDCLFSKNRDLATHINLIQEEGIEDLLIIKELNRYFLSLFKLYGYSISYGSFNVRGALGFAPPTPVINALKDRSVRLSVEQYIKCFDLLTEWRLSTMKGVSECSIVFLTKIKSVLC